MRKRQLLVGMLLLFMGSAPLYNEWDVPGLRGLDIVRLLAAGACFGIAFVALTGRLAFNARDSR